MLCVYARVNRKEQSKNTLGCVLGTTHGLIQVHILEWEGGRVSLPTGARSAIVGKHELHTTTAVTATQVTAARRYLSTSGGGGDRGTAYGRSQLPALALLVLYVPCNSATIADLAAGHRSVLQSLQLLYSNGRVEFVEAATRDWIIPLEPTVYRERRCDER